MSWKEKMTMKTSATNQHNALKYKEELMPETPNKEEKENRITNIVSPRTLEQTKNQCDVDVITIKALEKLSCEKVDKSEVSEQENKAKRYEG